MLTTVRPTRLFIVDPQPLIAAALQHFFQATQVFHVVETSQHVRPAILRTIRPDVVLLAPEHGSNDVGEAVTACRTALPSAKICWLSCHTHPESLRRVIDAGASGYTIKDVAPSELIDAVRIVARGGTYIDPRLKSLGRTSGGPGRRADTLHSLSERETEIIKLIAEGNSNREISTALSLSEKTVKNHISRIFAKLHITARTQAVVHAIKVGIA